MCGRHMDIDGQYVYRQCPILRSYGPDDFVHQQRHCRPCANLF